MKKLEEKILLPLRIKGKLDSVDNTGSRMRAPKLHERVKIGFEEFKAFKKVFPDSCPMDYGTPAPENSTQFEQLIHDRYCILGEMKIAKFINGIVDVAVDEIDIREYDARQQESNVKSIGHFFSREANKKREVLCTINASLGSYNSKQIKDEHAKD